MVDDDEDEAGAFEVWYQQNYDLETRMTDPGHKLICWEVWQAAIRSQR